MKNLLLLILCFICLPTFAQWHNHICGSYHNRDENFSSPFGVSVILGGGSSGNSDIEIVNTLTGVVTTVPTPQPYKGVNHCQAQSYQNKVILGGGWLGGNCWNCQGQTNILSFDPANNIFQTLHAVPANRIRGAAGTALDGSWLYIAGGNPTGHGNNNAVNWFDRVNLNTGQWQTLPNMPRVRDHFEAAIVNSKIYCMGGNVGNVNASASWKPQVDIFDIASQTWSTSGVMPNIKAEFTTVTINQSIYVIGGIQGTQQGHTTTVDILDTQSLTWSTGSNTNSPRSGHQAVLLGNRIWLGSGLNDPWVSFSTTLEYLDVPQPLSIVDSIYEFAELDAEFPPVWVHNNIVTIREKLHIILNDSNGKEIINAYNKLYINMSNFSPGLYVLRAWDDYGEVNVVTKVIK